MFRTAELTSVVVCIAAAGAVGQTDVRVATWNIETVGEGVSGESEQFEAAVAVLGRIGADVVAINEIYGKGDIENFEALAGRAGYAYWVVPDTNPFGPQRNGFLSKLPILDFTFHTSEALSGDPEANDITRLIIEVVVDVPGDAMDLTLVTEHFKSDKDNADEFRRACEAYRVGQAVSDLRSAVDAYVLMGDVNEEIDSVPRNPNPFVELPGGLPKSFCLGSDLQGVLHGPGIVNDPFFYLQRWDCPATTALDALQLDGTDPTRPASGRRLDYILTSHAVLHLCPQAEVYNSVHEGLPGGLPKSGDPLPPGTSLAAADHLLVFADITVPPVAGDVYGDFDGDCDVDLMDFARFQTCFTGNGAGPIGPECRAGDLDCDDDIDLTDYVAFGGALSGPCQ